MKLYICYGTFKTPRPGGHPCRTAANALHEAGHDPQMVKSYGLAGLPEIFNLTPGRRRVKELTGNITVPALELEDGSAIAGSQNIVAWAKANPASS